MTYRLNVALTAGFLAAGLTACGSAVSPPAPLAIPQILGGAVRIAPARKAAGGTSTNLYVVNGGNNTITVYAPGSTSVSETITEGVSYPLALAIDRHDNLYVSNSGSIAVYAPGTRLRSKRLPMGSITRGASHSIAEKIFLLLISATGT
jgi:DNA-binding beta-propeller fold protein YncE